jgi:tRNA-dihydrouridine synthase B
MGGIGVKGVAMPQLILDGKSLSTPFALAPLAELTEPPFRALVRRLGGCGLFYTPMLSPAAIRAHETHRIPIAEEPGGSDAPLVVQIAPSRHDDVADAIRRLLGQIEPSAIDINMGCAAPRVRRSCAGAALLAEPEAALAIVRTARRAWTGPLFAKLRLPGSGSLEELLAFSKTLVEEGVDAIALHPRLAREGFARIARWERIKELAEALPVPVLGSGDLNTARIGVDRLASSVAAAVMFGRAALKNPWIFREAISILHGTRFAAPSQEEVRDAILALVDQVAARTFPAGRAAARISLVSGYLLDPIPFGRRVAMEVKRLDEPSAQRARIERFLLGPDAARDSRLTSKGG